MNVIRVTKTARNRVDVVFTGDKYLFFNPDNGLIALAQRHEPGSGLFHVQRTEQISKKMIEDAITDNEPSSIVVLGFEYHEECNKPQHTYEEQEDFADCTDYPQQAEIDKIIGRTYNARMTYGR